MALFRSIQLLVLWINISKLYASSSNQAMRCASVPYSSQAHVAIGFYGLARNLSNVLYTIENHVFRVLDKANITYDVFSVTMGVHSVSSSRDATRGLHVAHGALDPYDIQLLRSCRFSILEQESVRMHEFSLFSAARKMPQQSLTHSQHKKFDEFHDNFESVKNALCSYYTQSALGSMITAHAEAHRITYDAVLTLRPDTAVVRDIDLPENLAALRENTHSLWVPNFQHWRGYNDRLAYGAPSAMSVYLERGHIFRDARGPSYLAERLVKHALDMQNITVKYSTARVMRVRQDRVVAERREYMEMTDEEWNRCVTNTLLSDSC